MFHPHIKKIRALSFLFVVGMPVFAMEEEEKAVRAVSPSGVHLRGKNIDFQGSLISPVPLRIQDEENFKSDSSSHIEG